MKKYRPKFECAQDGCGKKIFLRDGKPLWPGKEVVCPKGHINTVERKPSGGFRLH